MTTRPAVPLSWEELRASVADGLVDNVIVALPDLTGRLLGSRVDAEHYLDTVGVGGAAACAYLLAVDVDMTTGPGYAIDAAATGFGDFTLLPDPATLRLLPWDEGTALVLADAHWPGGDPVGVAPRQILRTQLDRLAARGLTARVGAELEFLVFREDYQDAWERGYRDLRPATRHNVDYAVAGLSDVDPLVNHIRRDMVRAGLRLESARGECHSGQYEIVFRHQDALTTCDNTVLYKTGAKQIAAAHGRALTFMAKFDAGEGNSCHLHLSLRDTEDRPVFAEGDGMSALMRHFIAGQLACARELVLFQAPNVNSYKRFAPGAFAPTTLGWGRDNRTCPIRVVGHGESLRLEHRVPGGDANPYLAVAAVIAAGLHGIDHRLELEEPFQGNAFATDRRTLPPDLATAVDLWLASPVAEAAFGAEVVGHYARAAQAELDAFAATVTDWELRRGFERL
ncbi:glutamine synthetase family protein [Crossiella cryophila]|uniref:Glutamine synthetase n=1 Tax=Crossiella cryophila TaxID=43355 RepID=A0A7W7FWB2_9PSEU|nr:glutamine synthetase family protein [Crossiella cryophila]MBB4681336.1 glutamine synthetase [Crossiella cryophila]